MNNLKYILLKDLYNQINLILLQISNKYNIDYQELHDIYLKQFYSV